jgi:hypothetical protein
MKVLVCGSRTFDDMDVLWGVLYGLRRNGPDRSFTELIHGAAQGADRLAGKFGRFYDEIRVRPFPADWGTHGKAAGPIRNQAMLDEHPNLVVAFVDKPLEESRGTAHMVRIAREAGVKTIVVEVS